MGDTERTAGRAWWRVPGVLWWRGVGPGVVMIVFGLFAGGVVLLFVHGTTPPTVRVMLARGSINAQWDTPRDQPVGDWSLGESYARKVGGEQRPIQGFAVLSRLSGYANGWGIDLVPRCSSWRFRLPLVPLGAAWVAVAGAGWWWRSRRLPAWACGGCGYDLRGAKTGTCPECGRVGAIDR